LFSLTGTAQGGAQSIAIQAALQHPFSMGHLWIATPNAFDYPIIDPGYLTHPADVILLREGLKLARKIGQSPPLKDKLQDEVFPGPAVQSDADWDAWLRLNVGTEYHPSCTCAMLPYNLGGVVDPNLRVYGTANVRVVDSSVYPIQFAAHLMAPTYGLAEQAAAIIRAQYNGTPSPAQLQTNAANPATRATSASGSAASSTSTSTKSSAADISTHLPSFGTNSLIIAVLTLVASVAGGWIL